MRQSLQVLSAAPREQFTRVPPLCEQHRREVRFQTFLEVVHAVHIRQLLGTSACWSHAPWAVHRALSGSLHALLITCGRYQTEAAATVKQRQLISMSVGEYTSLAHESANSFVHGQYRLSHEHVPPLDLVRRWSAAGAHAIKQLWRRK